jgi:glutamine synthetase type III
MEATRTAADDLETRIAEDIWPLPGYREMLSIK